MMRDNKLDCIQSRLEESTRGPVWAKNRATPP